ncbi:MAG TPA: hypothetical protein VEX43_05375 [Chthoniobacterales bacterium]|nr:hypothetical protein [Chthoniobacterales bacterium]
MKPFTPIVILCFILAFSGRAFAAPNQPTGKVRTISNISSIPHQVLQRSISPKFYKSLLISPIEGYVVVRGQVNNTTHLSGLRVIHSELGGAYDALALETARAMTISGYYSTDKITQTGNVLVTLLIYKIADGTAALSFAQVDEPGGDQQQYYGCAVLAVRKGGGIWTEIKSVDSLHGKGIALRSVRNSKFTLREIYFFAGFQSR